MTVGGKGGAAPRDQRNCRRCSGCIGRYATWNRRAWVLHPSLHPSISFSILQIGRCISQLVEHSLQPLSHANAYDALQSIERCSYPAVRQVIPFDDKENDNVGGGGNEGGGGGGEMTRMGSGNDGGSGGMWEDLASFMYRPSWDSIPPLFSTPSIASLGMALVASALGPMAKRGGSTPAVAALSGRVAPNGGKKMAATGEEL